MSLLRGLLIRLAVFAVSLGVASVLIFVVCSLLPGDVAQVILGTDATPEQVAALRDRLGLDRPLVVRYLAWVGGMLHGDFGSSAVSGVSVAAQLATRLPVTLWLVGFGMIVAVVVAIPVGMIAALRNRRLGGFVASGLSQVGLAVPAFWLGILLVLLFAVRLRWLPANGYVPLHDDAGQWVAHLVLPVAALGLVQSAVLVRYVRSAFLEVLAEDYYRTARAIGWTRAGALLRHGLRNAAVSVVTVLGLQLSTLLVGAIVIESVFTLPGLGSLLLAAVGQRDLIMVQGTVLVLVLAVLIINMVVDWSYLVIDPRLRTAGSGSVGPGVAGRGVVGPGAPVEPVP